MWFKRDLYNTLGQIAVLPIKVLKGPRQVGKTSLLEQLSQYRSLYFDDLSTRHAAQNDPRGFFDQFSEPLLLDEATLAPEIFPELKRRVDEERRTTRKAEASLMQAPRSGIDIWITGSNQTLLQRSVRESLAGRASYFDLNTLSIHELGRPKLPDLLFKGGWPELHAHPKIPTIHYLNDLIATFIEKDIVSAAGIEKRAAFSRALQLCSTRIGQLFNASDIAKAVSVDVTTVQSWVSITEQNGILRTLLPFHSNLNQRLIKSPKIYFEDTGLACRFQGWTEYAALAASPSDRASPRKHRISRNYPILSGPRRKGRGFYLRNKEKVEIDFLIRLSNQRYVAAEVKATPEDFSTAQIALLESIDVNVIDRWVLSPQGGTSFPRAVGVAFGEIWDRLAAVG